MSILDKKLLLSEMQNRLDFLPANEAKKAIEQLGEVLQAFEVTSTGDGADDESEQLIRIFLDAKAVEGKSALTIERYKRILERLRDGTGTPLNKLTVYHIRGFMMREIERGINTSTVEGNRSVYSSFFNWLHRESLIEKNPVINLAPIKTQKVVRKPFSDVEVAKLIEACKDERERALVSFLNATGCRVSEVCGLNIRDIDFHALQLTVNGKGNKQRTVYIDDVCAMHLRRYIQNRTDMNPALFIGQRGRLTDGGIRIALKELGERAGVENVHPHRFRRTLATNLIDHGMQIQEVAAVLGHDKLDTTLKYVYINQTNVKNAYRRYA